jgi:hypothetical protein
MTRRCNGGKKGKEEMMIGRYGQKKEERDEEIIVL